LFDNLDKLYGAKTGGAGEAPAEGAPGAEAGGPELPSPMSPPSESPAPPESGLTPESKTDNMNILLESDWMNNSEEIDLSRGGRSLNEIEEKLEKLLND
jgi:hypothetical protein